jgi:phage host-nuclease inhibitor protein Gam
MATKRLKKAAKTIETREQMEAAVREICLLTISRDETTAQMDRQLADVRKLYEGSLAEVDQKLEPLLDAAADWAVRNPDEFATRKSVVMAHGTVGFRTGMPKLKTLSGFTWSKVLEKIRSILPDYVRTSEEVDKERLIADRNELGARLGDVGVKVVQDETFFVEPLRTDPAAPMERAS